MNDHIYAGLYGQSMALLTDLYQLTMAYGYWKLGMGGRFGAGHRTGECRGVMREAPRPVDTVLDGARRRADPAGANPARRPPWHGGGTDRAGCPDATGQDPHGRRRWSGACRPRWREGGAR